MKSETSRPLIQGAWIEMAKIDHGIPGFGYPIGGINEKDTSIKFAECIEGRLLNAGVKVLD